MPSRRPSARSAAPNWSSRLKMSIRASEERRHGRPRADEGFDEATKPECTGVGEDGAAHHHDGGGLALFKQMSLFFNKTRD